MTAFDPPPHRRANRRAPLRRLGARAGAWHWAIGLSLLVCGCEGLLGLDDKTFDLELGEVVGQGGGGEGGSDCPGGVLLDGFNEAQGSLWQYEPGNGSIDFEGFALNLRDPGVTQSTVFIHSRLPFDFRGRSLRLVALKLPDPNQFNTLTVLLAPPGDANNSLGFYASNGALKVSITMGGNSNETTVNDDRLHWRIADEGGELQLQLSADGGEYETVINQPVDTLFPLDNVALSIRLVGTGMGQAEHVSVDTLVSDICLP